MMVSELEHGAHRRLPPHSHGHAYVCMLLSGGYGERYGRREVSYLPFTTVLHPEDFSHEDEIGKAGARFLMVEIPRAAFGGVEIAAPTDVRADLCHGSLSRAAIRLFTAHRLGEALSLALGELLAATSAERCSVERRRPGWLDRVTAMLHDCRSEPLNLEMLAHVAGVHPVHLSRTFERFEGCAVSERLRSIRVQHALREIACRGATLADAAAASGFVDQSHMTRIFRRTLGMTPGRFRSAALSRSCCC